MYQHFFKRLFDFLLSLIGLLIISPLLLIVWLLLRIANGNAGAFFTQTRPGKNGQLFRVVKFKTMNERKDRHGNLLPPSQRITPVGKVMRSLSIDELPQLFNAPSASDG
jgi:lipopolysaccharide/colanic/teichoic acid biosynthesis glycosyltransferase